MSREPIIVCHPVQFLYIFNHIIESSDEYDSDYRPPVQSDEENVSAADASDGHIKAFKNT